MLQHRHDYYSTTTTSAKTTTAGYYQHYRNHRNGIGSLRKAQPPPYNSNHHRNHRHHLQLKSSSLLQVRQSTIVTMLLGCIVLFSLILIVTNTFGIRILTMRNRSSSPFHQMITLNIPYPPINTNVQVSVIIMNHARPYLLQQSQLLPTLLTHPNIQTIYILHSNPQTAFTNEQLQQHLVVLPNSSSSNNNNTSLLPMQKIQHIDAVAMNEQMGLAIRFHFCDVLCNGNNSNSNDHHYVLHIDDDMEFNSHSVIDTLIRYMVQNPKRIIGHYGRTYNYWTAPFRHGYDTKTIYGPVEVVLTKILLLEPTLCHEFFKYTYLIHDLLHPTNNNSTTATTAAATATTSTDKIVKWNGEDIFMNLVANHYYHVPVNGPYNNYAISDLDVWDVDTARYDDKNNYNLLLAVQQPQQQLRRSGVTGGSSVPSSKTMGILDNAVSGNMDRNRIWNVGFYQWYMAYQKAQSHTKYRGILWYATKHRLSKLS